MRKSLLTASILSLGVLAGMAFPKALYVKQGDEIIKYNFGVAGNLKFSEDGKQLHVSGYNMPIELDKTDYISFTAPIDEKALTPSEQKERLTSIGHEVYGMFDLWDHATIFRLIDNYLSDYSYYDGPAEFEAVVDSYNSMMRKLRDVAAGDFSAMRSIKKDGIQVYRADDYFGVFEADSQTRSWVKTADADYLEFRFKDRDGKTCSARLTPSKEYTDWSEDDFIGRLPQNIVATLSYDGKELAKVNIDSRINDTDKALSINTLFTADKVRVESNLAVNNESMNETLAVDLGSRRAITHSATVYGHDLTNYAKRRDEMEAEDEYYDDNLDEWVGGDYAGVIARHFTNGVTDTDVIGQLQVKGHVAQFGKIYDTLMEDEDDGYAQPEIDHNKNTITYRWDDSEQLRRQADVINNYGDASFYYDGKPQLQGFIYFDVIEDRDEYTTSGYYDYDKDEWIEGDFTAINIYNDMMPVITFSDMTSFTFEDEDYFGRSNFSKLVNDFESIISTYDAIVSGR